MWPGEEEQQILLRATGAAPAAQPCRASRCGAATEQAELISWQSQPRSSLPLPLTSFFLSPFLPA